MDDTKVYKMTLYHYPAWYFEWGMYALGLVLFALLVLFPNPITMVAIVAVLLFQNYRMFGLLRYVVDLRNAKEVSKLTEFLQEIESKEHKDGTFQYSSGLKESSNEVNEED